MKIQAGKDLPPVPTKNIVALLIMAVAICLCLFWRHDSVAEKTRIDIEENCTLAESLMNIGELDEAKNLLEKNLKVQRHHPHTHFLLGEIYRQKKTIFDRRLSAENLKQAVIREPLNYRYHYSLGLTYLSQGFTGNALAEFKKVVRLAPEHADALRQISAIYREMGLRYDDREILSQSLDYAAKAASIEKNPNDYLEQAKLLVSLDLFDIALGKIDTALFFRPDGATIKKLLLVRGLCYLRLRMFAAAASDFDSAISLMNENERHDFEDVRLIVPPQEYSRLLSLSRFQRQKEIAKFWLAQDPDLTTGYNERRLEHFARQVYADIVFSLPQKGVSGRNTRRGETLIRLGFPDSKQYVYGDALSKPPEPSSWIWEYIINGKPISLKFVDSFHDGDFDFPFAESRDPSNRLRDDPAYIAENLARTIGQRYEFVAGDPLPFKFGVYQFKGNRGATELLVFYNISHTALSFTDIDTLAHAKIEIRAALHKPDLDRLDSLDEFRSYAVLPTLIANPNLAICDDIILAGRSDSAILSLAIEDRSSRRIGMIRSQVPLRNFLSDKVTISDLVLARQLEKSTFSTPANRRLLRLFTNLDNRYFISEPVVLYFEFYNLELGINDRTEYLIRQTISRLKRPRLIGVITGYQVAEEVTTVFEGSGYETFERRLMTLDFSRFKPGRYRITIEVIDEQKGDTALASSEIILYE